MLEDGSESAHGSLETSHEAVAEFCKKQELTEGDLVGIETGMMSNFVADGFEAVGVRVVVIEAGEV